MFRQFALTISAAVVISTINALTLSPALCGILLRRSSEKRFFLFRWFNTSFDSTTRVYKSVIWGMVRRVALVMLVVVGLVMMTGWSFTTLPTGFLPEEDQGYCFVNVQLPDAASRQRTDAVLAKLDEVIKNTPGVANFLTISGYSILSGNNGSNLGLGVVIFEPWEGRTSREQQQNGILAHLRSELSGIEEAVAFAFVPPAIDGLGAAGGFQMQLQDRGGIGLAEMQAITDEMLVDGSAKWIDRDELDLSRERAAVVR